MRQAADGHAPRFCLNRFGWARLGSVRFVAVRLGSGAAARFQVGRFRAAPLGRRGSWRCESARLIGFGGSDGFGGFRGSLDKRVGAAPGKASVAPRVAPDRGTIAGRAISAGPLFVPGADLPGGLLVDCSPGMPLAQHKTGRWKWGVSMRKRPTAGSAGILIIITAAALFAVSACSSARQAPPRSSAPHGRITATTAPSPSASSVSPEASASVAQTGASSRDAPSQSSDPFAPSAPTPEPAGSSEPPWMTTRTSDAPTCTATGCIGD